MRYHVALWCTMDLCVPIPRQTTFVTAQKVRDSVFKKKDFALAKQSVQIGIYSFCH